MLPLSRLAAGVLALAAAGASAAPLPFKGFLTVKPATEHLNPASIPGLDTSASLPLWSYSVTAGADLGGGTYTGQIIGADPASGQSTTLTTQIVPLIITITDKSGTITYDPTAPDPCDNNLAATDVVLGSPIFQNNPWTSNGVNVGNTQYIDAFQRAEFWGRAQGNYHVLLNPVLLPPVHLNFTAGKGLNFNFGARGGCGYIGIVWINNLDRLVTQIIKSQLSSTINPGTFPIFLTKDVVESLVGTDVRQCCVLGYHGGYYVGQNLQIYSPFAFDSSGAFGGDVTTLSHEMAEAVNDPSGQNATPVWGNIGQVQGHCQGNFEVGDPLSPGWPGSPNPIAITGANGYTYHVQELAYFNWYFGGPSLGTGGKYSFEGTFGGDAILCANGGGTNQ